MITSGKETNVDIAEQIRTLPWRLLAEYDEENDSYVIWSVDTGAVASAATPEETQSLIKRILENDIRLSYEADSIANLCRATAPEDVRIRWSQAKVANPGASQMIMLSLPGGIARRSVQTELTTGKTKRTSAA
jgi:hypothetical protein